MQRRFQRGISVPLLHKANIVGTARIVFDEKTMKFQGVLIAENDSCFSFHGYAASDGKQRSNIMLTNFDVLDGETGHNFKVNNVNMKLDIDPKTMHRYMILEHESFKFVTKKWLRGNRADIEISEHINPEMTGYGCDVFVGDMTINIVNRHNFVPLKRRLGISLEDNEIIESSNDFLA
ncbi:Protein SprT [Dirofilaria immitis]